VILGTHITRVEHEMIHLSPDPRLSGAAPWSYFHPAWVAANAQVRADNSKGSEMMLRLLLSSLLLSILLAPLAAAQGGESQGIMSPSRPHPSPLDEVAPDGRPTLAGIAVLQSHARNRAARVWIGDTRFDVRRVRVDSLGITLLDTPRTDSRAASLVPWATIDRFETRRSYMWHGILGGAVLGALAAALWSDSLPDEPGAAAIVIALAAPPAGALLGGVVGGSISRWQNEWPRDVRQ